MIGLDTNILVRYLTQDDPEQSKKAIKEIEEGLTQDQIFFIADIVLCELAWVLETAYRYKRLQIAQVLDKILRTKQFEFQNKDLLWQSLDDYQSKKGDFTDHLIGRAGHKAGCRETLTFDIGLRDHPKFRIL